MLCEREREGARERDSVSVIGKECVGEGETVCVSGRKSVCVRERKSV